MEAAKESPILSYGGEKPKPKSFRLYWKWPLLVTVLALGYFLWQARSAMVDADKRADAAVQKFHVQMDAGDFEGLLRDSHEGFQDPSSREEFLRTLADLHQKLGKSGTSKRVSLQAHAGTEGTSLTATYETTFEKGRVQETFTWEESGRTLKLTEYSVRPKE